MSLVSDPEGSKEETVKEFPLTYGEMASMLSTKITPQDQLPPGVPAPEVGRLDTPVQDRKIQYYFVSEVELRMFDEGLEGTERFPLGIAIGAAVACAIVDRTVKGLSPNNHALFVWGFFVSIALCLYFANKVRKARSLIKNIVQDVRKRPREFPISEGDIPDLIVSKWEFRWPIHRNKAGDRR